MHGRPPDRRPVWCSLEPPVERDRRCTPRREPPAHGHGPRPPPTSRTRQSRTTPRSRPTSSRGRSAPWPPSTTATPCAPVFQGRGWTVEIRSGYPLWATTHDVPDERPARAAGSRRPAGHERLPSTHRWEHREPKLVTHSGHEWLYVLAGELRLVLGTNDTALRPGGVAEFDTSTPHWFGPAHAEAVQILHLFRPHGDQPVNRTSPCAPGVTGTPAGRFEPES
ncbi:cupin domain-containing protein [Streptomyces bobili]|uniref:cupin domain-containing protein n=1 Tax=Streptomyces bobili TaxID=67280 RepID=UPI00380D0A6B